MEKSETLLTFPCDFTIKIFGAATSEFEAAALGIIHEHVPNFSNQAVQTNASENGKYKALSVTVHVESKEQLDRIYQALTTSPHVLMAL